MIRFATGALAAFTLLGCQQDYGLLEHSNLPPTAKITSHGDPAVVEWERPVLFEGEVSDDDHETHNLRVTWYLDGEPICEDRTPAEDGYTSCTITPDADAKVVELFVRDPRNATGRDQVNLTLVEPGMPSATILEPEADGRYYAGHPIHFLGRALHPSDPPSTLTTAWSTDLEGALGFPPTPDGDGLAQGSASLVEGTHQVVFEVTDTYGSTAAATREIEVGPPNSPPECSILAPADMDRAEPDDEVLLQGMVTDADQPAEELEVTWWSSIDGLLAELTPDADGNVSHTTTALSAGLHTLVLEGVDELGANCVDTVLFVVGSAPWAIIVTPEGGDIINEDEEVSFLGTVGSLDWSHEELTVTWASDLDGVLHASAAPADGSSTFSAMLSPGEHLVTLAVEDPTGEVTEDTVTFRINGLPSAPVIDIDPSPAYTTDALSAVIVTDSVDPEGEEVTYTYQWLRDGVPHSTGTSVASSSTAKGQVWTLEVTPHDDHGAGTPGVATRVVANAPPNMNSLVLTPKPAFTNTPLLCDATAGDADGDEVTFAWEWRVNGTVASTAGETLSSSHFTKGQEVICQATPYDGTDYGEPMTDSVVVSNSPPSIDDVHITPSSPATDATLTAVVTGYSDPDGDLAGTHLYTWQRQPPGSSTWSLVGTGASTLGPEVFSKGDRIRVRVIPRDDEGAEGDEVVSSAVTIQNTPPVTTSVIMSPKPAVTTDTLHCDAEGEDEDGDTVTFNWEWRVGSTTVYTGGDSLAPSYFQKGQTVTCIATAHDGTESGTSMSDSTTIQNSPPSIDGVDLDPSPLYTETPLTASVTGYYDPDDDPPGTHGYTWYRQLSGSSTWSEVGGDTATLASSHYSRGDSLYVVVVPRDSDGAEGPSVTSGTVTVQNSPPSLASVYITPSSPTTTTNLTANLDGYYDADGDPEGSHSYTWYRQPPGSTGWTPVGGHTATLHNSSFSKGDRIYVQVVPRDVYGAEGEPVSSAPVTIGNTPPVVTNLVMSPIPAYANTDITCTPTGSDIDGDTITWFWEWRVAGTMVYTGGDTLASSYFVRGQAVECQATPYDGTDFGEPDSRSTVIENSPPSIDDVNITPSPAYTDTNLSASVVGYYDADGDLAGTHTYTWYHQPAGTSGWSVVGGDASTLASTHFVKGDRVYVRVVPHDSTGLAGDPVDSSPITIQNSPPSISTVSISPTSPVSSDTLTSSVSGYFDPDDDPEGTHRYTWQRRPPGESWAVTGTDSPTLASGYVFKGDEIRLVVIPRDAEGAEGDPVTSNTVTVGNSPPSILGVNLTPTSPTVYDTLVADAYGYTDPDDDPPGTHQYRWFREPAGGSSWNLLGATGANLNLAGYAVGDRFYVEVTPRDADGLLGEPHDSNIVQIRAPSIADRCDSEIIDDDILCVPEGASVTLGGEHCYTDVWILGTLHVTSELVIQATGEIWVGPEGRVNANARGWGGGVPNDNLYGGGGMGLGEGGACGSGPGHGDEVPEGSTITWQTGQAGSGGGLGGIGGTSGAPVGETCTMCHEPDEWFCKGEPGQLVGTASEPTIHMGGGGGAAGNSNGYLDGGEGGRGGGAVALIAEEVIIDGRVTANGEVGGTAETDAEDPGGGGGAGGTILILAYEAFSGGSGSALNARGGGGGTSTGWWQPMGFPHSTWQWVGAWGGGGGGGGRIKIYAPENLYAGTTSVAGGPGGWVISGDYNYDGEPGYPGTVHTQTTIPAHELGVCF